MSKTKYRISRKQFLNPSKWKEINDAVRQGRWEQDKMELFERSKLYGTMITRYLGIPPEKIQLLMPITYHAITPQLERLLREQEIDILAWEASNYGLYYDLTNAGSDNPHVFAAYFFE